MGAWPSDDLTKVHLDAATDDPSQARGELVALIDKVKVMIAGLESANTANAGVKRDSSGNFSAGTITAALTGTASQATNADTLDSQHGSYYQNSTNQTAGTLPDARLSSEVLTKTNTPLKTILSATNGSIVTLTTGGGNTTIATIDLGTVAIGDIFDINSIFRANYPATSTVLVAGVQKSSGTATVQFNHNQTVGVFVYDTVSPTSVVRDLTGKVLLEVTGAGTLVIKLYGSSNGTTMSVLAGSQFTATQLYNA